MKKIKRKYITPGLKNKKIKIYFKTQLGNVPLESLLLATDNKED
jgi:hypothetical protein